MIRYVIMERYDFLSPAYFDVIHVLIPLFPPSVNPVNLAQLTRKTELRYAHRVSRFTRHDTFLK